MFSLDRLASQRRCEDLFDRIPQATDRNRFLHERKIVLLRDGHDLLRQIAGAKNEMCSYSIVLLNGLPKKRDSIPNRHVNIRNDCIEEPLPNGLERHLAVLHGSDLSVPFEHSFQQFPDHYVVLYYE